MTQHAHGTDSPEDTIERSSPLHIQLLGGFQVRAGDRPIPDAAWRTHKARGMVKLLCLSPQHQLHRDQLVDLLWPELEPEAAASNLRATLYAARRALEPERVTGAQSCLYHRRDVLVLDPPNGLSVDVETFETAAAEAFQRQSPEAFRRAIDLYAGDLLPEDRYEDWAAAPRESLRDTYLGLLLSLAYLYESRGVYAQAISMLERVIAADVTHEDAHAGLMRVYALSGRPGQALRQYERLKDGLMRELDVEPSVTSQRLHANIAAGRFPAPESVSQAPAGTGSRDPVDESTTQHNLPAPLTSFIGRRHELDELHKLLSTTRLITLSGLGGSGKSRLALELSRQLADAYPDGVWLVELASLADPALVPTTVAATFSVHEQAGQSPLQAIVDALRPRSLVLVLDNCEHLIDACAGLVETLLMACPELRILATSREALRVPGEVVWRVPPLSLPLERSDESLSPDLDQLVENGAVALFVDRVRWVRPGFALTTSNAMAVAQICRRLDGLPLALELAAARASVLAPEQMAERLDDALRLLSGGSRTASSRQHTLRATLDWSYALLDSGEQTLLRRLAVFAGGWTLDAVEAVCAWHSDEPDDGSSIDETEVLTLLAHLVDKSLVQVEEADPVAAGATGIRYRLLETVRQYAAEQLAESSEEQQAGDRHANYYVLLAEEAEPLLTGPEQSAWLGRLEREHDNLRAARHRLAENGDIEREARLCVALLRFWSNLGYLVEGEGWLADTLARSEGDTPALRLKARLLQCAAMLAWRRGDTLRSEEFSRKSLPLFQAAGDQYHLAGTFHNLGAVAELQSNYLEASRHYREALRLREEVGDKPGAANTLHNLGNLAREQGDLDGATALYERELMLQREIGTKLGIALALSGLGVVALDKGDYALAVAMSTESHNLYQEVGAKSLNAMVLQNLGFAFTYLGEHARALAFQNQCLRLTVDNGDKRGIACGLEGVASAIALFDTSPESAERSARLFGAAEGLRDSLNVPLPPADLVGMEGSISTARNTLGEEAFNAAWAAGRALPLEEVVAEALDVSAVEPDGQTASEPAPAPSPASLSRRELDVAKLVAQGHTNTQIASILGMARPTADKHVSNILRKLAVPSRAEVRAWAIEHGLVSDDATSS